MKLYIRLPIEAALLSPMCFNSLLIENSLKHLHVKTFPGSLITYVKSCLTVEMDNLYITIIYCIIFVHKI